MVWYVALFAIGTLSPSVFAFIGWTLWAKEYRHRLYAEAQATAYRVRISHIEVSAARLERAVSGLHRDNPTEWAAVALGDVYKLRETIEVEHGRTPCQQHGGMGGIWDEHTDPRYKSFTWNTGEPPVRDPPEDRVERDASGCERGRRAAEQHGQG